MTEEMADGGERRPIHAGKLAWGAVLIVLGGVLLIEQLDVFYFDNLIRYWPLVLVAVGGVTLATARGRDQRHSGMWLLGIGGWLLVNTLGLWGFWWANSWPLILILAGSIHLLEPKPGRDRLAGLFPLGIGAWCLVNTRELGGLWWSNSWPLLLIVIGVLLVSRSLPGARRRRGAEAGSGPAPDASAASTSGPATDLSHEEATHGR